MLLQISSLEQQVGQIDSLKDELEVSKHASENLKKSEALVSKLRKRLEEAEDWKARIEVSVVTQAMSPFLVVRSQSLADQTLEAQNKELEQANSQLESQYSQQLSQRSRKNRTAMAESDDDDETTKRSAETTITEQETVRLRKEVDSKNEEIESLRSRLEELEAEASLTGPEATGGRSLGDEVQQASSTEQVDELHQKIEELELELKQIKQVSRRLLLLC